MTFERWSARCGVLTLLSIVACGSIASAEDKVGVAAAVKPDAYSVSGGAKKQINIGKSIVYNERISTDSSGIVQVLLLDGSTFTVGANSNLVIDKFIYDPNKKTGQLVATFSKGSLRFIGGKVSKAAGGVQVNTPSGALAIRGGMFQGNAQRKIYSFLYGNSLTFRGRNGQSQTIRQSGYTFDLSGGRAIVRPTTPQDIALVQQGLTGWKASVASTTRSTYRAHGTRDINASQLIEEATATRIQAELQRQLRSGAAVPGSSFGRGAGGLATAGAAGGFGGSAGGGAGDVGGRGNRGVGYGVGGTPPCPSCGAGGPPGRR